MRTLFFVIGLLLISSLLLTGQEIPSSKGPESLNAILGELEGARSEVWKTIGKLERNYELLSVTYKTLEMQFGPVLTRLIELESFFAASEKAWSVTTARLIDLEHTTKSYRDAVLEELDATEEKVAEKVAELAARSARTEEAMRKWRTAAIVLAVIVATEVAVEVGKAVF